MTDRPRCIFIFGSLDGLTALILLAVVMGPGTVVFGQTLFTDVTASAPDLSTNFVSTPGDGHGPGVIFNDLNNDGYADIYMIRSAGFSNGLFINTPDGPSRTFVRASGLVGAVTTSNSNGAISADYDNDGDQDIFVINWNQTHQLYQNQLSNTGQFMFIDVTASTDPTPGVGDGHHGLAFKTHAGVFLDDALAAAWADPDRDGDLDLYIGNHHEFYRSSGLQPGEKPGQRDIFYQNNGNGTFTDQTTRYGLEGYETATGAHSTAIQNFSSSQAVIWADFNNDHWPDLLVSNKVGGPDDRDMLYINRGADDEGNWLGMSPETYNLPTRFGHMTGGAMGISVADLENDGDLDIYFTDWSDLNQAPNGGLNDVWINQLSDTGTLDFVHSNQQPGIFSWGTQWEDFDNNGFADLYASTETGQRDVLYMNGPDGLSTIDTAATSGLTETYIGRGAASADFNRDGKTDLMVINPWNSNAGHGVSKLYENTYEGDNHYIVLELIGDHTTPGPDGFFSTRDAIGARATITADLNGDGVIEDNETLIREVVSGSSSAGSTSSLGLEFGLGLATEAFVHVHFPSGRTMSFLATADQYLLVDERAFLPGDLDGDGFVGINDLNLILTNWNKPIPPANPLADPNGDGFVGIDDLSTVLGNWNNAAPVVADTIPEPAMLGLLMLGVTTMIRRSNS